MLTEITPVLWVVGAVILGSYLVPLLISLMAGDCKLTKKE